MAAKIYICLSLGFHLGILFGGEELLVVSLTTPTFVGTLYWHVILYFFGILAKNNVHILCCNVQSPIALIV